jgi:hypothetical protein
MVFFSKAPFVQPFRVGILLFLYPPTRIDGLSSSVLHKEFFILFSTLVPQNVVLCSKEPCQNDFIHTDVKNMILPRAKALSIFKFLQLGIPIVYNGEEIGIDNDYLPAQPEHDFRREAILMTSMDLQNK